MPKRTNPFQQLVYLIQHQLKDRPDTQVTESKMLADRQGGLEREVDIVVECSPNGVPYILAFECCAVARKATIEWVERQIKKHEHLSDKLVLVARKGFTRTALDLARREGAVTITLSEAAAADWPACIDEYTKLFFCTFDFQLLAYGVEYEALHGAPPLQQEGDITLVNWLGQAVALPVGVTSMLRDHELFGRKAMDFWYQLPLHERKGGHTIKFRFEPTPTQPLALTVGDFVYRLKAIHGEASVVVGEASVEMGRKQYQERRVAHGAAQLVAGSFAGQTVHVMLSERQGEQPLGTVMFTGGGDGTSPRLLNMTLQLPSEDGSPTTDRTREE
jgi:hypothetical protein